MNKDKSSSRLSFKELQSQIEDSKQKRDDLNKKTKEFINSLQDIETEVIESLKIARDKFKKRRDYFNEKVKTLKDKKIEYKNLLSKLSEEKKKIQNANRGNGKQRGYTSLRQIERKIENYERIIETENLNITEENAIIDKIKELAEIKQEYLAERKNNDLYVLERKIEIVKINLNKIYEQLNKWSNKSQDYHQKMLDIYQKVNGLKEKKKQMEEELIENKKQADQYHATYLKIMNQKKKITRSVKGRRQPYNPRNRQKPRYAPRKDPKKIEQMEKIKQDKLAEALEKQKAGKKLNLYEARLILEQNKS
jgi:uncharacterized coiled-coil DUF342 family protein